MPPSKNDVLEALEYVQDPEIGMSVVELGLVYEIGIVDKIVNIIMTLTTPACPFGPQLIEEVKHMVSSLDGVEKVDVEVTFEPPWNPAEMASDAAKDVLGIW
jgi:metal-sulfur cluster biosynthetic enzyme